MIKQSASSYLMLKKCLEFSNFQLQKINSILIHVFWVFCITQ